MHIVSTSDLHKNTNDIIRTIEKHTPTIVAGEEHSPIIMVSLADLQENHDDIMNAVREFDRINTIKKHEHDPEWAETIHQMRSAKNHVMLLQVMEDIKKGFVIQKSLEDMVV